MYTRERKNLISLQFTMPEQDPDEQKEERLASFYEQLKTTIFTSVRRRNHEDTGFLIFLGLALVSIAAVFAYFFIIRLD